MAASVGMVVTMEGKVTAVGTSDVTVDFYEVLLDGKLQKFSPAKSIVIANTEYSTTELTISELDLFKKLAAANKDSQTLTDEEKLAAKSVIAKLTTV